MKKILAMVCAVMILISAMPVTAFADGNSFDYSIGAEVVSDSQPAGSIPEGSYWQERTVDKELSCTEEHSHEDNCYSAITPYKIWTLCGSAPAEPEQTPEPVLKANEEQITKSLTVSMGFAADSDVQKAACTASASVQVKDQTNTVVATLVLSPENDFTASCELPEATTAIFVTPSGGEMAGYSNQFAFSNANHVYYVPESGQINAALTVKYYNPCTVSVNFTFHPESELGAEDFPGGFDVQVRSATTLAPADTLHISPENNWSATSKPIVPGKYFLQYQNTSKEGYYMEPINMSVFTVASNENAVRNISGRYSSKGTLNVVSSFDENSALDGEDLIALGINKLAFEILDSENNVVATDEIDDRDWSVAVGDFFPGTYSVRFTDTVPGYTLSVSNTSATVVTGETVAIKPSLCFTEEEQSATAKISIDFAETSDLNRDNYPGYISVSIGSEENGTESYSFGADTVWEAEFEFPAGLVTLDIESEVLEDYYLENANEDMTDSGCDFQAGGASYWNPDEYYYYKYHDIEFAPDGSLILNITLDIRAKEVEKETSLLIVSLNELALLHEGGTTTETSVGNTGYESESYTVTVTPKDGEAQSKQITADTLCNFNVFVGDELTITLSNGYYTYEFSEDELIVDSALERVTVDVTYHYAPRSPFAVDCLNVDKNTGAALGGGEFYLAPPPDSTLAAIGCVANDNGEFGFIISEPGTYTIGQSKAPQGYQLNNSTITLTVETMWTVAVYSDNIPIITDTFTYNHSCETDDNGNLLFKNTNETVELTVVKRFVFDKKEDRPESIVVALYRDGVECDRVTLSEANNWTYTWKKLPGGYEYTVDEPIVPAGYVKYFIVEGSTVTIVNSGNIIPATGDQDINLWLSLAIMSLFGCTSLIIRRRKNEAAE